MRWRTIVSFFCILAGMAGLPSQGVSADVTLNGYVFSDDSTELLKNPYFSLFSREIDISTILYGYGDFEGKEFRQIFWQQWTVAGIPCILFREQGYLPSYNEATSSFDMEGYDSGSVMYAKDTEDNIHVLSYSVGQGYYWDYSLLPEGGTTLKYPSDPVPGQQVFCGHVEATGVQLGEMQDVVTISFDSLPQYPSDTVTEYLRPGAGVIAVSYNWEGRTNGYSFDGAPPGSEDERENRLEKWRDSYCLISICRTDQPFLQDCLRMITTHISHAAGHAADLLKVLCSKAEGFVL
jgi:hypothetical protein